MDLANDVVRWRSGLLAGIVLSAVVFVEPSPADICWLGFILVNLWRIPRAHGASVAALAVFQFFSLISLAFSPDFDSSIRHTAITVYLSLVFVACFRSNFSMSQIISAVNGLVILFLFTSLLSGVSITTGLFAEIFTIFDGRSNGLFKDPNVFGAAGATLAVLALAFNENSARRMIVFSLLAVSVVLSFSRIAILSLVLGFVTFQMLLFLAKARGASVGWKPSAPITLIVCVLFLQTSGITGRYTWGVENLTFINLDLLRLRFGMQHYDFMRFQNWEFLLNLAWEHPFGIGANQAQRFYQAAHNTAIQLLSERGWGAFVAFAIFVIVALRDGYFRFNESVKASLLPLQHAELRLRAGLLSAIIVNLVCSIFIDITHWRHFWLILILAASIDIRVGTRSTTKTPLLPASAWPTASRTN